MPTLNEMIIAALDEAEANAEKIVEYASMMLAVRRRIRNALDLLDAGRTDEVRTMLQQALAEDGGFLRRRMTKIMRDAILEDDCDDPPAS